MSEAHRILVHNCHLDGYGHVNNARYLEFLEQARWTYFRRAGVLDELGGARLVVAHIDIRYRHATVLDDELLIASRLLEVQSRRLLVSQTVTVAQSGKTAAEAAVTLIPTRDARAFRLPETLLAALQHIRTQTTAQQ